jgi:YHS domain-containing protein
MQTHRLMDPVCGLSVDRGSPWRHAHHGRDYFFCSESCRQTFQSTPDAFAIGRR